MKYKIYQVDAFTNKVFGGNPAAIVPLEEWLDDDTLLAIAEENNLSETAYFVKKDEYFHLRWFTPVAEIELCGHATLASAYVLFNYLGYDKEVIHFETLSGPLYVKQENDKLSMDFPVTNMKEVEISTALEAALGTDIVELYESETKWMAVLNSKEKLQALQPDFKTIASFKKNVLATAKGDDVDFVSRFFAPAYGIDEDPVTGSAHTALTPYWSKKLGKEQLTAKQISKRGGDLTCILNGERVELIGSAKLYMVGEISWML